MGTVGVIFASCDSFCEVRELTVLSRLCLGAALSGRLAPYILSAPDVQSNEVQPRTIRTLRVPDYFAEYRDKGDGLASFLGTSIVAKVRLSRDRALLCRSLTVVVPVDNVQRDCGEELCVEGRLCEYGA